MSEWKVSFKSTLVCHSIALSQYWLDRTDTSSWPGITILHFNYMDLLSYSKADILPLNIRVWTNIWMAICRQLTGGFSTKRSKNVGVMPLGFHINSVVPGRFNFQTNLLDWYHEYFLGNCSHVNAMESIGGKSTFVQVMAWCHQVTSHYMSQCWPRFMML